jgi:hypothetical protein
MDEQRQKTLCFFIPSLFGSLLPEFFIPSTYIKPICPKLFEISTFRIPKKNLYFHNRVHGKL